MRTQVRSQALLSGLKIRCCRELWCRSQLGSRVAAALVQDNGCSSDWTPSLGTSTCHGCGPKKKCKRSKAVSEQVGCEIQGEAECHEATQGEGPVTCHQPGGGAGGCPEVGLGSVFSSLTGMQTGVAGGHQTGGGGQISLSGVISVRFPG